VSTTPVSRTPVIPRGLVLALTVIGHARSPIARSAGVVVLAALAVLFCVGSVSADCINYADYLHWVGSADTPGTAYGVAVSGTYAYVADGSSLQVIDISDPQNPGVLGSVATPGNAWAVAVSGSYVYVADDDYGLQVVDISNPASPQIVGAADTPNFAYGVAVSGGHAYVADAASGLQVIDISNPTIPQIVGSADTPGIAEGIAVRGTYAYIADGDSGLQLVDISEPESPLIVGSVDTPGHANGVAVSSDGNLVYLADLASGLRLIEISDGSPYLRGHLETPDLAYEVAVDGDYAYVAVGAAGITVIDVSDPDLENLYVVGSINSPGSAEGVFVSGTHVYVADTDSGLQVIDTTNPLSQPIIAHVGLEDDAYGVATQGGYAYVPDGAQGLAVISVNDPESPVLVTTVDTPGTAYDAVAWGDYIYLTDGASGLQVIDIANVDSIRIVGSVDTPDIAYSVAIAGTHAYVADRETGLVVIDIANPSNPQIVGTADTPGYANGVVVRGSFAYVGDRETGLQVIDIADPQNPQIVGSVGTPDWASEVAVAGTHVYVAALQSGLLVVDITDPENPQIVGIADTPGVAWNVVISGTYAYVGDHGAGLQIVDISDPEHPRIVGSVDTPGHAWGAAVSRGYVYLADAEYGFDVLPSQCCMASPCGFSYLVRPDGTGDFPTIQTGVNSIADGDTLLLGNGTFTGTGNRDVNYFGKSIVVRSQSDDPLLCTIDCQGLGRGFMLQYGEDASAVLSGVSIENGLAEWGGGIFCSDTSPLIERCVLRNNAALTSGGGIYGCGRNNSPTFSYCVLLENYAARSGGGAEIIGAAFDHCVFDRNRTGEFGACLSWAAGVTLDHCILGFGLGGEAVDCSVLSPPQLSCCDIYGNEGGDWVGWIADQFGVNGNFSGDPLFCADGNPLGYYAVAEGSPCAPENNPTCGLVGIRGTGCSLLTVDTGGGGEFPTIQNALNAASGGDVILLLAGTYLGYENRELDSMGRAIIIRSQIRGRAAATINCEGLTRGFVFKTGEGPGTVLDGLRIINGNGLFGAAVFCSTGTSPTLRNCTFAWNRADSLGGGVCCWSGASPTITNCSFEGDSAVWGGGLACLGTAAPALDLCTFSENAAERGAGAHFGGGGQADLSACTFVGNVASAGGAVYCDTGASPDITNCTLVQNSAPSGGGFYSASALPTVTRTIVAFGTSGAAFGGTAVTLSACDLYGNAGGDWFGSIANQVGVRGNFSLDPQFCDLPNGDYRIWDTSPCAVVACGPVGAMPVGCYLPMQVEPGTPDQAISRLTYGARCYPNPSEDRTVIEFTVPPVSQSLRVRVRIYDLSGRLVRTLLDAPRDGGTYAIDWDGSGNSGGEVPSGVYYCRVRIGDWEITKSALRVK
jgi:hypothetical protein